MIKYLTEEGAKWAIEEITRYRNELEKCEPEKLKELQNKISILRQLSAQDDVPVQEEVDF